MGTARDLIQPDRSGFLALDNRQIRWEYFGSGERDVVCLFNGLAMSTESWYRSLPGVLGAFDVLLYDYPGQGRSSCEDEPYRIPDFCHALVGILDTLGLDKVHGLGMSYGGFVALDFARLHQQRLSSLTLSGILLSHEESFQLYQELSLRFYRGGALGFELYTYYLYEKIFGETFLRQAKPHLEKMRQRFHDSYKGRVHCLVRLTEAQNPFFAGLDAHLDEFRAIATPTLVIAGAEDRVILPRIQRKICDVLPNSRFELIEDAGHVAYLEKPDRFFGLWMRFAVAQAA
jgi:pimeloyl-ACP methyl ester carboxylesterase